MFNKNTRPCVDIIDIKPKLYESLLFYYCTGTNYVCVQHFNPRSSRNQRLMTGTAILNPHDDSLAKI